MKVIESSILTDLTFVQEGGLPDLKERLFNVIFISTVLVGCISLFPSFKLAFQDDRWLLVALYAVVYLWGLSILLVRRISFSARTWSGLLFFYTLGIVSFLTFGSPDSIGVWLLTLSVVASLLLGFKAGMVALVLGIGTISISSWLMSTSYLELPLDVSSYENVWLTGSITFVFLSVVVTISLAFLVRAVEQVPRKVQLLIAKISTLDEQIEHEVKKYQQAQEAMQESEERYFRLMDDVAYPMFVIDFGGAILDANLFANRKFGYTKEEIKELSIEDIIPSGHRYLFADALDAFAVGESFSAQSVEERISESSRVVELMSPFNYRGKQAMVVIIRDGADRDLEIEKIKRIFSQQQRLLETARHLTESFEVQQVLERIGLGAKQILDASGCVIYLLEEDGETLTPVISLEPPYNEDILSTPINVNTSFTGRAVLSGKGLIFNEASNDDTGEYIPGTPENEDERFIAAPFMVDGQVRGAMCLNRTGKLFSEEDLALAETFAAYASIALKTVQIYTELQSEVDERERAELALRNSESLYWVTVDSLGDALHVVDTELKIISLNSHLRQWMQEFGIEVDAFGKCVFDVFPFLPETVRDEYQQVLDTGEMLITEESNVVGEKEFITETRKIPVLDEERIARVVTVMRDITARKQQVLGQEAIIELASTLRGTNTRADMLPVILGHVLDVSSGVGAAFAMRDQESGDTIFELAQGAWSEITGDCLTAGEGLSGHVINTRRLYLNNYVRDDPREGLLNRLSKSSKSSLPSVSGTGVTGYLLSRRSETSAVIGVPLISKNEIIGVLWVGRTNPFTEGDIRVINALGEMAASAIQRATLHEETQGRVQRLNALHNIDKAITTDFDLDTILNVLLNEITSQLGIDAADILLYDALTQTLSYASGRGFKSGVVQHSALRIGKGFAGRVALERRLIHIPNLSFSEELKKGATAALDEGFTTYFGVPLIAKGEVKGVLELYHRTAFEPDQEWLNFFDTLSRQAAIAIDNVSLFDNLQRSNLELKLAYDTTLEGWAKALELRDKETEGHAKRVVEETLKLAREFGMSQNELVHVRRGALLHDIGKMGIPDSILNKPGPLSDEEWETMRQHPDYAFNLLSSITFLRPALDIPYCHHEKWDGTGYPRGLEGEQIPLAARIFGIVDVYDALLNKRPYRPAWSEEKVIDYINEQSGKHFDPRVVELFLEQLETVDVASVSMG